MRVRPFFALSAALALAAAGDARIRPADMIQLVPANYAPVDKDERGLWDRIERIEEELASSNLRVRDPALTAYVEGVLDRITPSGVKPRLVILRSPDFNAAMFPNGLMLVNTGLLTRLRNEAQLAAVLAHETGHYLRLHSIRGWRDMRRRSAAMNFIGLGIGLGGLAAGVDTSDMVRSINSAIFLGAFAHSRELEAEADAMSLTLMRRAGYDPAEASVIWQQMILERDASARARGKRPRRNYSIFDSHPANEQRMADLAASARELQDPAAGDRRAAFVAAMRPVRGWLLDDQVKLNDPGASFFILDAQARDGWDGLLHYEQAEAFRLRGAPGDRVEADRALGEAVALPDAPALAWRAQGYAMIRAGRAAEGRAALAKYLELAPAATDAAMVRHQLTQ